MAKLIKILKALRNNWKKSIFFFGVVSYGVNYGVDKYNSFQLMREYCEEALQYGDVPVPRGSRPRQITVILNPAANKRSSKADFEKYCAPLLYLAGISVNVVQTEYEGQARKLVESLDGIVDAIVVAGGDGTVSETVTGLLRRSDGDLAVQRRFPIGILPLGRTNTVAESLFSDSSSNRVKMMADATMSIVREVTKPIDVLKIEVLQETEDETPGKPIYSLGGVHWGAYRDAEAKKDKYWYWGTLRSYASYIFMGWKDEKSGMTWQCDGELTYILPCGGCSKCHQAQETDKKSSYRWWHVFMPRQSQIPAEKDYSKIINKGCGEKFQKDISTVDLSITTGNTYANCPQEGDPHVEVDLGPKSVGYMEFVSEGWRRLNKKDPKKEDTLNARELELRPKIKEENPQKSEHWISIDNEDYEVKPIHLTLLPKKVHVFCTPVQSLS